MLEVLFHGFLEFWTIQIEVILVYDVNTLTVENSHKFVGTSGAVGGIKIAILKADFFPFQFTVFAVFEPLVDPLALILILLLFTHANKCFSNAVKTADGAVVHIKPIQKEVEIVLVF